MSERKPRNGSKQRASLGFVLMLMLSSHHGQHVPRP